MVVPESSINNIMGGLESTGGVTLHNHRRKLKQRFETIAKLGQGTYGKVQLGINKETGQEVAIKTIKKCKIETEADLIRIRREIQIMSSLRHPYIIHIYEVFENRDKMVLVMEYAAGGELYDYLSKRKVLEECEARRIFRQIAMAVYYCHKHQICHRDLKLENILLDEQGNAKIADFGLSNVFDKSRLLSTFCGSPLYASPEIVKGIPYEGPEVDCWSLGVLLYTLVYGAMPFDGSNFKRLVRQISAGEYFEPKTPSTASELIAGLLTVKGTERLDISGVCRHSWMAEEDKVSCYRLAVELAEQEPNRLDLLLALAPQENQIPSVPEEVPQQSERPVRSMSLSSLATVQPTFDTAPTPMKVEEPETEKSVEKKRERSTSRSRRRDSDEEKPRKKSIKMKKKSEPDLANLTGLNREEMENVLEEAKRLSEIIAQAPVAEAEPAGPTDKQSVEEKEHPVPSTSDEVKDKPKEVKKVKKVKQDKDTPSEKEIKKESPKIKPKLKKEKEVDVPEKSTSQAHLETTTEFKKTKEDEAVGKEVVEMKDQVQTKPTNEVRSETKDTPIKTDPIRRKSKVFETAELFSKSGTQDKIPQKKVFLPGVKVSDAKAAFERRSSMTQDGKADFNLASTVNVNKLVQNELNRDDDKIKKENAIKVISHAISESEMNKASTLPRRKLSKPLIARAEPEHMVANTSVSQVIYPAPVPPPRPSLVKQDSGPKEHIIPIQIERREDRPPPISKQASVSSRASSSSLGRQDSDSSTTTLGSAATIATCAEPIRKSPREVIIPIAVEGGGYVTPSASTLSKMNSVSESEEEGGGPMRGFGLHSTRRRVETTDSLSSDEDDDNFEMLTAENLFSTLLSRVRNLTHRLNVDEGRPTFPRLFNHHSIFDSPSRRLTETKSFSSDHDPTPWRKKRENASSSTLPRGFSNRSFRRTLTGGEVKDGRPPISRKRSEDEVVEDFLATGKLSSLDRVRNYLEGLRKTNIETTSPLRRYLSSESPRPDYPSLPRHRLSSLDTPLVRRDRSTSYNVHLLNSDEHKYRTQPKTNCANMPDFKYKTNSTNMPDLKYKTQPKIDTYNLSDFKYRTQSRSESFNASDLARSHDRTNYESEELCQNDVNGIEINGNKTNTKYANGNKGSPSSEPDNHHLVKSEQSKTDLKGNKTERNSRVNKAINSLRKKSELLENQFTESNLLKRAISLEDIKTEMARNTRASSLKPEGTFEKKGSLQAKRGGVFDSLNKKKEEREARIANLKRLDLGRGSEISAESTPTGDNDEGSILSITDNSDTWSSCDLGERLLDPSVEECVSERIRRKSFYHRFNTPKKQTYHRSTSNMERKRYY